MAKSMLDKLLDRVFDANYIGRRGEKLTERELKLVSLFGRKGKTLRNVYVPKDNGETTEIDLVYITQKGIFVFESKNYSGWIFGDTDSAYWTASLPNGQKNKFYNPIRQNAGHIKWLRATVGEGVPLFSIIVFSERCELKKVPAPSEEVRVIKRDRTYAAVRAIWDSRPDILSAEDIDRLYALLDQMRQVDAAVKQQHIDTINEKYKAPDRKTCPRCGSELVLRTIKKGERAGSQFYGCANYPKCRYTAPMD